MSIRLEMWFSMFWCVMSGNESRLLMLKREMKKSMFVMMSLMGVGLRSVKGLMFVI